MLNLDVGGRRVSGVEADLPGDGRHELGLARGEYWILGTCGTGGCYSHVNLPNTKACYFSGDTTGSTFRSLVGASSNHPGGVNVAFLDGSVKFIKNSISVTTWWALATKAGGEVVSSDSY